ncbi:MAG: pyridoxal-phosphate dependent enzyme [Gemmatimonadota bacterium]
MKTTTAQDAEATRWLSPRALTLAGLGALAASGGGAAYLLRRINEIPRHDPVALREMRSSGRNLLLERYPALADRIPWRPLGVFPTPVEPLPVPPGGPRVRLFVKRDDLSSALYAGNKVRKLEHFLADAELSGRRTLITLGGLGSNHALATARHGGALGFAVDLALYDQPVTPMVRKNLGGFLTARARLHDARNIARAFVTAASLHRRHTAAGDAPYFIMVGGTSRLGCIGHVTAAIELAEQVAQGVLPEPDMIFVPLGTCGTAAGLIAGLRIAGLRSRVVAVRVADPFPANRAVVRYLAQDVADFLHRADPAVPRIQLRVDDFEVVTGHYGPGYGVPTAAGERAVRWAAPLLSLETTYSGKTLAACLERCGCLDEGGTVLFWNTFSSAHIEASDRWSDLPAGLHRVLID